MTASQRAAAGRIVVGVDGSDHSKLALEWAARIAAAEGAWLDVVAVWETPTWYGWAPVLPDDYVPGQDMQKLLDETVDDVFGAERPADLRLRAVRGYPAAALLEASKDALMLVVGSRGHGGFRGLLLGSVSANVAEHATCPVLVVHRSKPDTGEAAA